MCVYQKIYFKISMLNKQISQLYGRKWIYVHLDLKWRLFNYEPFKFKNSLAWGSNFLDRKFKY